MANGTATTKSPVEELSDLLTFEFPQPTHLGPRQVHQLVMYVSSRLGNCQTDYSKVEHGCYGKGGLDDTRTRPEEFAPQPVGCDMAVNIRYLDLGKRTETAVRLQFEKPLRTQMQFTGFRIAGITAQSVSELKPEQRLLIEKIRAIVGDYIQQGCPRYDTSKK